MRFKIPSKKIVSVLGVIGSLLYVAFLFYFIPKDSVQSDTAQIVENITASPSPEPVRQAVPARLQILAIGVDSAIEEVGLTSDRAMDVPKNINNIGWFDLGPRPGEVGTAVIDGHYGISKGRASAFDNLYKLRKGDKIDITDQTGAIISFIVTGNRRYDPKSEETSVFSSSDGKSHLSLITCEGVWDDSTKSYTERLVVFADKE